MKALYISLFSLLTLQAVSQQPRFEYCQIVASSTAGEDPQVESFLFGYHQKRYADSMLKAFRLEFQLKRVWHANATDAMNFLGKSGWELHNVYLQPGRSSSSHHFYVMKRKL